MKAKREIRKKLRQLRKRIGTRTCRISQITKCDDIRPAYVQPIFQWSRLLRSDRNGHRWGEGALGHLNDPRADRIAFNHRTVYNFKLCWRTNEVTNGVILEITRLMTVFIFAQIWSSQVCPSPIVGQPISHMSSHCAFERIRLGGDKKSSLISHLQWQSVYAERIFWECVALLISEIHRITSRHSPGIFEIWSSQ